MKFGRKCRAAFVTTVLGLTCASKGQDPRQYIRYFANERNASKKLVIVRIALSSFPTQLNLIKIIISIMNSSRELNILILACASKLRNHFQILHIILKKDYLQYIWTVLIAGAH
jgi:hypothetical protein